MTAASRPEGRSAVVVAVDGLTARRLGPYGDNVIATPALNALAAESLTAEWHFADAPRLADVYREYWQGVHPLTPDRGAPALAELVAQTGAAPSLVTDEPALLELAGAAAFAARRLIEQPPARAADGAADTQLGRLLAAAADEIDRADDPHLLWIHARGLAGPWDAPHELRQYLADDDESPPPAWLELPTGPVSSDDVERRLAAWQAYGAQVMALDECLDALLTALDDNPLAADTLLVLTSPRGVPLGEHGWLGQRDDWLYAEQLHTPLWVRWPDRQAAAERTPRLLSPADVWATLLDWFGATPPSDSASYGRSLAPFASGAEAAWRERLLAVAGESRALRTDMWRLLISPASAQAVETPDETDAADRVELYVQPDDGWEYNEVADRCVAETESLQAAAAELAERLSRGEGDVEALLQAGS